MLGRIASVVLVGAEHEQHGVVRLQRQLVNHDHPHLLGDRHEVINALAHLRQRHLPRQVARGGFRYNRTTNRYVQLVTLKNIGTSAITGPISLVLDSLSSNAALANQTGVTGATSPAGSPYINVTGSDLAVRGIVAVTLEFTNPTNNGITYTTRVLAGPGQR